MKVKEQVAYQQKCENGQAQLLMLRMDNGTVIAGHIALRLAEVANQITEVAGDNPTLELVLRELEVELYNVWVEYLRSYLGVTA